MEKYNRMCCRVATLHINEKIANRIKKITNVIDDIDDLEDEFNIMYRNFKFKNIVLVIYNLPVFKESIELISRNFAGSVSDVNLMRKIASDIDDLTHNLKKINTSVEGADKDFDKYKKNLRKIHNKIKKLS